jgi:hypothetical protein
MTTRRQDLLQALTQIQNHPAHSHHDILTITGCGMSDAEVIAHIDANMAQIARYSNYGGNKRRILNSYANVA